jgi:predicted DNA-binding transcriptional regulator
MKAIGHVLMLLSNNSDPQSAAEIARTLELNRKTIDSALWKAHREGLVYIAGWHSYAGATSGPPAPLFACGARKDAVRPTPEPKSVRDARYRNK